MNFDTLKDKFDALGREIDGIQATLLVGSYARGAQRPDSDIDIVMITDTKNEMIASREWLARLSFAIGSSDTNPAVNEAHVSIEYYGLITSLRLYIDSQEYEIGLGTREWIRIPLDEGTRKVLEDGYRILYEKGGILEAIRVEIPEKGVNP